MKQLPAVIQGLQRPEAYPDSPHPQNIELVQTQMSFLLFAGDFVYKIKKPVNLGYLDYSTIEKRRFFCDQEIKLNRRLCPDTYLGVVPVTGEQSSVLIGGQGDVIEYAVKMRRLPSEMMMNSLLPENRVTEEMLKKVARKLAAFHAGADTGLQINTFGSIDSIKRNTDENFEQTEKYIGRTIHAGKFQRIKEYTGSFLGENTSLFANRIKNSRIRDCHGDLHAAHICFADGICIYDCIEFNDRFRYCDTASEIAFLAMDLDHYGKADLSNLFVTEYADASSDRNLRLLLKFYKTYRAYVRGKVESFKIDDPYISDTDKKESVKVAAGYFDLAGSYVRSKPLIIMMTGLVGTGKSTAAFALARRLGLMIFSSDVIRKQIAGVPADEHHFEDFTGGIYSPDYTLRTYDKMYDGARSAINDGYSVVLDASFISRAERTKARDLAKRLGADIFAVECTLSEENIRERLSRRLARKGAVSDGRWDVLEPQKKTSDPVSEFPDAQHIVIDTQKPWDDNIQTVIKYIEEY